MIMRASCSTESRLKYRKEGPQLWDLAESPSKYVFVSFTVRRKAFVMIAEPNLSGARNPGFGSIANVHVSLLPAESCSISTSSANRCSPGAVSSET